MADTPQHPAGFSLLGESDPFDAAVGEISFVRRREPDPDWAIHELVHRNVEVLAYADAGKANYECGGRRFTVEAGHLIYFPRGTVHSATSDPGTPWSFFSAAFELQFPREETAAAFAALPNRATARNRLEVGALFAELDRLWAAREPGYLLRCRSIVLHLMHTYVRASARPAAPVSHSRRLMAIARLLQENYARSYSIEELAEQAGLSPSRFRALFKQMSGHPVVRYQNWLRVNKARDLLLSGEYTVTEAAAQVGFTDVYYFSRVFKTLTGFSPSYYRNQ